MTVFHTLSRAFGLSQCLSPYLSGIHWFNPHASWLKIPTIWPVKSPKFRGQIPKKGRVKSPMSRDLTSRSSLFFADQKIGFSHAAPSRWINGRGQEVFDQLQSHRILRRHANRKALKDRTETCNYLLGYYFSIKLRVTTYIYIYTENYAYYWSLERSWICVSSLSELYIGYLDMQLLDIYLTVIFYESTDTITSFIMCVYIYMYVYG